MIDTTHIVQLHPTHCDLHMLRVVTLRTVCKRLQIIALFFRADAVIQIQFTSHESNMSYTTKDFVNSLLI